jgi:hypothetical protein
MVYCVPVGVKLAVSVIALFMVTVRGLDALFTLPVKPLNWKPLAGVAVIVTWDPLLYEHPPGQDGVTVPPPDGLTIVVSGYDVPVGAKVAVRVIELFIATVSGFDALFTLPLNPVKW